ncbi:MAG: hypothetical protein JWN66_3907 [Sphingomonas bacterium]|jgi:hypothetical protein|uniref:Bbp16 family capsid cement protein n=1 Tax=Sphingomonas bacterium TaxID=1895847 RepID=UPI002610BA9E|nr:hypothetical protein [Sphingomonas bacterium]MDB5706791.1 hypothetical protein [Sphingomonas bacterium]
MIFDATTLFSNAQAVTATAASTNIVDLGSTGTVFGAAAAIVRDVGKGREIAMRASVVESFNNLTSLTIGVETDDNAGFASARTVWTSPAYALADLATGAKLLLPDELPVGTDERYLRLKYTVAGTAPTLGKITAGVTAGNQTNP